MVVDTSGLWPIPAVSLVTSCLPLVTSLSAGIGAGSLVTSLSPGVGDISLVTSLSIGVAAALGWGDCGACRARPSCCRVVVVVDTSGLWPIPAVSLVTSCLPLV
uniref:hypothetical protein n=1 Tax=Tessaracoccus bendigoensis TaxID=72764 RepID=UPI001C31B5E3